MIPGPLLAVVYGLFAALAWGGGDFSGGFASRQASTLRVVIFAQLTGTPLLAAAALLFGEPLPAPGVLAWSALAGLAGAVGLLALYRGLAVGRMGVVAPVAAVISGGLPLLVGIRLEGPPGPTQALGFALAIPAVWLLTRGDSAAPQHRTARRDLQPLLLPIIAGVGFGFFFVLVDFVSEEAVLWPLASARIASVTALVLTAAVLHPRSDSPAGNQGSTPGLPVAILLAGVLDTTGNVFFALASRTGRLDVAAVLSSLYPATTVLLAWIILGETLDRSQRLGVLAALLAVALISL